MGAGIVFPDKGVFGFYLGEGTNQIAELSALYLAVSNAESGDTIFTDSMYGINIALGRWTARMHLPVVDLLRQAVGERSITIEWVRGHSGNYWNELADEVANRAANERRPHSYAEKLAGWGAAE
jgi:ribonuclease HI